MRYRDEVKLLVKKIKLKYHLSDMFAQDLEERYMNFIYNGNSENDRNLLLKLLKNTDRFGTMEIQNFMQDTILELLDNGKELMLIRREEDFNNSTNSLITQLYNNGYVLDSITTDFIKNEKFDCNKYLGVSLCYIDDFVGSGSQLEKVIKLLDKKLNGFTIYIIVYIWLKDGKNNYKEYIKNYTNNDYILKTKGSKECKNINDMYKFDREEKEQILNISKTCMDKKNRYGYNKSKSLLTINDLSPNNNLSLVWRNDLQYNKNRIWQAYSSRSFQKSAISNTLNIILRNKTTVKRKLDELNQKGIVLNERQFKLIIFKMNLFYTNELDLARKLGYDSISCSSYQKDIEAINSIIDINKDYYPFNDPSTFKLFRKINKNLLKEVTKKLKQRKLDPMSSNFKIKDEEEKTEDKKIGV